jgi:hypothetical protein
MNVLMDGREREGAEQQSLKKKKRAGRDKMFISHADDFNMHANAQLDS